MKRYSFKLFLFTIISLQAYYTQANVYFGAGGGKSSFEVDYKVDPPLYFDDQVNNGKGLIGYDFEEFNGLLKFESSYDYFGDWSPYGQKDELSGITFSWTPYINVTDKSLISARFGTVYWESDVSGNDYIFTHTQQSPTQIISMALVSSTSL